MSFDDFMTDSISVLKKNGERLVNLRASVQSHEVFINRSDILIESGDLIERSMSNGGVETFEVIDPGFQEQFHGIEAHYQMKVRKLGIPEAKAAVHQITYNINGPNARVNQNSVDNSINIATINPEILEHLEAIRSEIATRISDPVEQESASEIVDAIQDQFESGRPKRSVISTLIKALPSVGSIASLGSFILSCL